MRAILYSPENSTNVRFVSPEAPDVPSSVPGPAAPVRGGSTLPVRLPRRGPSPWLRAAFRAAATLAPPLAVRWAERAFGTPPRLQARLSPVLASGHRFYLDAGGERLAVWSWGDGPTAVLLHGWAGRPHRARLVRPGLRRCTRGRRQEGRSSARIRRSLGRCRRRRARDPPGRPG